MGFISIEKLTYYYPNEEKPNLDKININIEKGEIILIAGNSGSGKSTLARCISGAIPNFYGGKISGDIFIEGINIKELTQRQKAKKITMVFQDPEKQIVMGKVHREIAFGLENIGIEEKEIKRRVWEALQFSNILHLAYRGTTDISGGEKQKVAIASAISYLPECIIFDEPTSQLDPTSSEEIIQLMKKINEELGITIIIIEQKIERCFQIAEKILLLENSRVAFYGTKEDMYKKQEEYVKDFLPIHLKLTKELGIDDMPENFKAVRKKINEYSFKNKLVINEEKKNEIISIKNLACGYGNGTVIENMNFTINEGELLVIMGSNGSGKSTLLKSIIGLLKYKGSIKIKDKEVKKQKLNDIAKLVGYVSQNPNDYISHDTVYEELKFTLNNFNMQDNSIIDETLKTLEIFHLKNKNPRDLSGGERQRVAVASILVLNQEILLLDEPTRGLDIKIKDSFGNTLLKLKEQGKTIVMITHDIEFASKFANKFLLMFNGEIINYGTKEEVLSSGIYYTTCINKLLRNSKDNIFTLEEAINSIEEIEVI